MNSIDDLASIGDLVSHLHRLADAAETIAACMSEDRQRRQAAERTELAFLRKQVTRADDVFRMADQGAIGGYRDDYDRQWHQDAEREMNAAHDRRAAFEAAHPWITEGVPS